MSGASQPQHPIYLLAEIEARARRHAKPLPAAPGQAGAWDGLGFRIGSERLVAPLRTISEVLPPPRLTRIPGARAWLRGLGNLRGELLPIIDLNGFLGGDLCRGGSRSRVLVVQHEGLAAGLLVDEVLGLKHFREEQLSASSASDQRLRPYLLRVYRSGDSLWPVFHIQGVLQDPRFLDVAA